MATRYPVGLISQQRLHHLRAEAAMRRGDEPAVKLEIKAAKPIFEATPGAFTAAADALKKLIEAIDPFANGPAFDPPAEQWLGELQLAAGKPKEALAAFEAALKRHPRLSRALLGAARAAKAAGEPQLAKECYAELAGLWADADADLPALAEVRAGMSAK